MFYTIDVTYQFFVKGYYNSNFATNLDKSRFLIGCVFTFGGTIINWECNLQHIIALSTTKTKCMTLTEAIKELMWLQGITFKLRLSYNTPVIFSDS